MADESLPPALPGGKFAGREELLKLGKRWDSIGRCKLVKIGEVDERDVGTCFQSGRVDLLSLRTASIDRLLIGAVGIHESVGL